MDKEKVKKFTKEILDGKIIPVEETFRYTNEFIAASSEALRIMNESSRDSVNALLQLDRDFKYFEDEPSLLDVEARLRATFFKPTPREVIDARIAPLLARAPKPSITEEQVRDRTWFVETPEDNDDDFWGDFFDGFAKDPDPDIRTGPTGPTDPTDCPGTVIPTIIITPVEDNGILETDTLADRSNPTDSTEPIDRTRIPVISTTDSTLIGRPGTVIPAIIITPVEDNGILETATPADRSNPTDSTEPIDRTRIPVISTTDSTLIGRPGTVIPAIIITPVGDNGILETATPADRSNPTDSTEPIDRTRIPVISTTDSTLIGRPGNVIPAIIITPVEDNGILETDTLADRSNPTDSTEPIDRTRIPVISTTDSTLIGRPGNVIPAIIITPVEDNGILETDTLADRSNPTDSTEPIDRTRIPVISTTDSTLIGRPGNVIPAIIITPVGDNGILETATPADRSNPTDSIEPIDRTRRPRTPICRPIRTRTVITGPVASEDVVSVRRSTLIDAAQNLRRHPPILSEAQIKLQPFPNVRIMGSLIPLRMHVGGPQAQAATDQQVTDLQPTDLQPTDQQVTNLQVTNLQPTDQQVTDLQPTDLQPTDQQVTNLQVTNLQPTDQQVTDLQPTDLQPTDQQVTNLQVTNLQPTDLQPTDLQPTDLQPTDMQPRDQQVTDLQPTDLQPTDQQVTDLQAKDQQAKDQQAKDQQAKDQQAKDQQAKDKQATDQQEDLEEDYDDLLRASATAADDNAARRSVASPPFDEALEASIITRDVVNAVPFSQLFRRKTSDLSCKAFMVFCNLWCLDVFTVTATTDQGITISLA